MLTSVISTAAVTVWLFSLRLMTDLSVAASVQHPDHLLNDFNISSSGLIHGSDNLVLERYRERVRILHQLLRTECPKELLRGKRDILSTQSENVKTEVEKLMYERMSRMLALCRQRNTDSTTVTTVPTITTTVASPDECLTAINLTESWRQERGTRYQPGGSYACDPREMVSSRPWFRFTGAAGNRLLSTCPPSYSCGTHAGFWSNDTMPLSVGISATINVYGSWNDKCDHGTRQASVMRCSTQPHDYIYIYLGDEWCASAFCGMSN